MKKTIFLFVAFVGFSLASMAQGGTFAVSKHNFGKIKQNVPATYTFTFKNNNTKPIVIETATADCGCTSPTYPKEPIMKGQQNKVMVTYNAANIGKFTKKVHVKFANVDAPVELTIEGEVVVNKK
ncbi:MAG: DUF1573 domain-containing protein [Bacteroidetes bacterium]|nr:DUF1573 domain-containing protein [Bacteroidota bacterium]MBS1649238.1 DUF1573 domain-containing protein [Bacteroidota bacterium]